MNGLQAAHQRRSTWLSSLPLVLLLLALACSSESAARDQWLVVVDSDAPVPLVGDRLLVELLDDSGQPWCDACRRQFGLDERQPWPVSFGVAADAAEPPLVRARLYRAVNTDAEGLPLPGPLLDTLVRLPAADGVTAALVDLRMACWGSAVDLEEQRSCRGRAGQVSAVSLAGDPEQETLRPWSLAEPKDCQPETPEHTVCVPSGGFLRGDQRAFAANANLAPAPEELTLVSSFFLDRDEFTVGQYRAALNADPTLPEPALAGAEDPVAANAARFCTYLGPDRAENDAFPLNCVPHTLAQRLCAAKGMRLPTEAEWEFAAGNGSAEMPYAWGDNTQDPCLRAVYGLSHEVIGLGDSSCRLRRPVGDQHPGPRAGSAAGDVTLLGVRNLVGNLSEWVTDTFVPYAASCWQREPWLHNPVCEDDGEWRALRGGNWLQGLFLGASTTRNASTGAADSSVGFRCALSANSRSGTEP